MRLADGMTFAVLDVETTGVLPRTDRVVEVAVVRMDSAGRRLAEFATLVNPERDVGDTYLHGISATDVVSAPTFRDVLGDVIALLSGAVVVGHNVRFDLRFLDVEAQRARYSLPPVPFLCTLHLSRRVGGPLLHRRLAACCEHAGIAHDGAHEALNDATATARLLVHYLGRAAEMGVGALEELGCETVTRPAPDWPPWPPSGRELRRTQARQVDEGALVQRLLARLETAPDVDAGIAAYYDVLDRVLEDRRITPEEADALYEVARLWGLEAAAVRQAHGLYLRAVADAALGDGQISPAEQKDLEKVAKLLGIDRRGFAAIQADAEAALAKATGAGDAARTGAASLLAGQTVCFTGALSAHIDGERITRTMAERLAAAAGLEVCKGVSSDLDILVVADPNTQSTKARKARQYGTRVIAEMELWRQLGVAVS
jgi:DNA polymerase-3 subunit epsilon